MSYFAGSMRIYKQLFAAGLLTYAVLTVLSLLYYKERAVLPDDANYVFDLVTNGGGFAIFHQRFIAALTQLLPVAAIRIGWTLDTVCRLYSLNVTLFYAACYLLCGLRYRNYPAALALLLSHLLFSTFTFYWMVSELGQGLALCFLLLAVLSGESARTGPLRFAEMLMIVITLAYAHTLLAFVLGYLLLFLRMGHPERRRQLIRIAILYAAVLGIKFLFRDPYDHQAMGGLRNFIRLFPYYLGTQSMRQFMVLCTGAYGWIPVVLLINTAYYLLGKHWLKPALMLTSCAGYLLLVTVAFPDAGDLDFYQENLYLPLAVFLAVPLVYDVLPAIRRPVPAAALYLLIMGTGLFRIWMAHRPFTARLAWQRALIRQYDQRKVILDERAFPKDMLMMSWSSPYEFWLLSSMESGSTASLLISAEPEKYAGNPGTDVFITSFGTFHYGVLSTKYFKFRDTSSRYERIPTL